MGSFRGSRAASQESSIISATLALIFHPRAEKNLLAIPKKTRLAILAEIGTLRTMDHPLQHRRAKKLQGIENSYRIRVGDYRILTELKDGGGTRMIRPHFPS